MKMTTSINKFLRRSALSMVCATATCLVAGGANAQILVTDTASISENTAGFASQLAQTVEQYTTQLSQYATELNQYAQMISSIQGLSSGMTLLPTELQQITDETSYVEASCPGGSSGILDTLTSSLSSVLGGSITQQQQQVCAQIVHWQIDKYNKTVVVMNQLNNYASQFQQIEHTLASITTMADTGRAANQAFDYNNAVTTQMSGWRAAMQSDDAMISSLQSEQSMLASKALRGSNTVLGNLVQAAALKAAFTINQ
jgi:hypothetical protein